MKYFDFKHENSKFQVLEIWKFSIRWSKIRKIKIIPKTKNFAKNQWKLWKFEEKYEKNIQNQSILMKKVRELIY